MTKQTLHWRVFHQTIRPLCMLLLAGILFSPVPLRAQDYYQTLTQELTDSFNLPAGEFLFANTYEEALTKFYMEGTEYNPPADGLYTISTEGMPFSKALRTVNGNVKTYDWSNNFKAKIDEPVAAGDILLLVMYVKSVESSDKTGNVYARALIGDFGSYHTFVGTSSTKWVKQYVAVKATESIAANTKVLQFFVGDQRQTMDVGGIALINFGSSVTIDQLPKTKVDYNYEGRDAGAAWRAQADARIENIRKSNLTILVKDSAGNLVNDAKVEVHMKKHVFKFGSLVHNDEFLKNEKYREVFLQNFNWGDVNSKYNIYDEKAVLQKTDQVVNLLRDKGVQVRMNTLVYPQFMQPELITTPEKAQEFYNIHSAYVRNVVSHFKGRIESHNVLNEAPPYPGVDQALQPLFPGFGNPSAQWFKIAHEAGPDALLEENNFGRFGNNTGAVKTRQLDSAMIAWVAPIHVLAMKAMCRLPA